MNSKEELSEMLNSDKKEKNTNRELINEYDYDGFEISEFQYNLAEMGYLKEQREKHPEYNNMSDLEFSEMFLPVEWSLNNDYRLKVCLLLEANAKNVKVNQLPGYSKITRDVFTDYSNKIPGSNETPGKIDLK